MTRVIIGSFQFPGMDGQPHPQQLMSVPEFVARPQNMMGFADAVRSAIVNNYVNFSGRASRSEFWWFFLFVWVFDMITTFADTIIFGTPAEEWGPLFWIGTLALIFPLISVQVRRLHDKGRSGWWLLIGAIPCIGIIVLIVLLVEEGDAHVNAHGDVPTNTIE